MSDDHEDDEYPIGYKKPPKHTQWKKGQSGNPSGKKAKTESLQQMLQRLAVQEIVVHKNGVQMSMTQIEAMLSAVFAKAMKGDIACVRLIKEVLGVDTGSSANSATTLEISEADMACLKSHADWVAVTEAAWAEFNSDGEEADNADETG